MNFCALMSDMADRPKTSSLALLTHCGVVYAGPNECSYNEVLYQRVHNLILHVRGRQTKSFQPSYTCSVMTMFMTAG